VRPARVVACAGLGLAVLSYFLLLLPVEIGVYGGIEAVIVAIHFCAAISAAGLALGCFLGDRAAIRAATHPLVLIVAAIVAWSALVAPAADFPWLSIVGTAQSGEGVLMKADYAVFLAAGLWLSRDRPAMTALVVLAVAVSWVAALLAVAMPSSLVWGFGDTLAFYSAAVAVLVAWRFRRVTMALPRGRRLAVDGVALGLVAALPSLAVSSNNSAVAVWLVLGVPGYLIARAMLARPSQAAARRVRLGAAAALVVLPFAATVAVELVGPQGWVDSIRARALIDDVVARDLADHSWKLALGQGWGHAGETFSRYLTAANTNIWDQSWDVAFRSHFHSLNYVQEALLSAGLPAALAALVFAAAIPLSARRRALALAVGFALIQAGVYALWFELPMTLPCGALALAVLFRPVPRPPRGTLRYATMAALGGLALAQLAGGAFLLDYDLAIRAAVARHDPGPSRCDAFPAEQWRASIGLRAKFLDLHKSILDRIGRGERISADELDLMRSLLCAVDARSVGTRSSMLASAPLQFRADVAATPGFAALSPEFAATLTDWRPRLVSYLVLAPWRTDLALPYFAWLLNRSATGEFTDFAGWLDARRPNDPVSLWATGVVLIESPDPARRLQGVARLKAALDAGIERLIPLPEALKARIRGLSGP